MDVDFNEFIDLTEVYSVRSDILNTVRVKFDNDKNGVFKFTEGTKDAFLSRLRCGGHIGWCTNHSSLLVHFNDCKRLTISGYLVKFTGLPQVGNKNRNGEYNYVHQITDIVSPEVFCFLVIEALAKKCINNGFDTNDITSTQSVVTKYETRDNVLYVTIDVKEFASNLYSAYTDYVFRLIDFFRGTHIERPDTRVKTFAEKHVNTPKLAFYASDEIVTGTYFIEYEKLLSSMFFDLYNAPDMQQDLYDEICAEFVSAFDKYIEHAAHYIGIIPPASSMLAPIGENYVGEDGEIWFEIPGVHQTDNGLHVTYYPVSEIVKVIISDLKTDAATAKLKSRSVGDAFRYIFRKIGTKKKSYRYFDAEYFDDSMLLEDIISRVKIKIRNLKRSFDYFYVGNALKNAIHSGNYKNVRNLCYPCITRCPDRHGIICVAVADSQSKQNAVSLTKLLKNTVYMQYASKKLGLYTRFDIMHALDHIEEILDAELMAIRPS